MPDTTAAAADRSLPPRIVVVTGASAGLGRAITHEFARQGDSVALLARDTTRLKEAVEDVERMGGRCSPSRRMSRSGARFLPPSLASTSSGVPWMSGSIAR